MMLQYKARLRTAQGEGQVVRKCGVRSMISKRDICLCRCADKHIRCAGGQRLPDVL